MKTLITTLIVLFIVGCNGGGGGSSPLEPEVNTNNPYAILPIEAVVDLKTGQSQYWKDITLWENAGDFLVVEGTVIYEISPGHVVTFENHQTEYDGCQVDNFFSVPTIDIIDQDQLTCPEGTSQP